MINLFHLRNIFSTRCWLLISHFTLNMPGKKKSIVSGTASKMPPSFLDNLSDFSSDDELQQEQEQLQQPPQTSQNISTEQPSQTPTVPTTEPITTTPTQLPTTEPMVTTPTSQSIEQTSDSSSLQVLTPSYDIAQLLDEIAANVRDINAKVEQYNCLMEKTYEYLKLRYRDTLTDENMDSLKVFLINSCSTNKPYTQPVLPGKHKLHDTGEKICGKKRKL